MTESGIRPRTRPRTLAFGVPACLLALTSCTARQVQYEALTTLPLDARPVEATVFLVGDAGAANSARDAVLAHLGTEVEAAGATGRPVVVAYLGDNIYELGARETFIDEDLPKLEAQIEPLGERENVRGVFVPGNHDWARGASSTVARTAIRTQQEWLERLANGRDVALLPADGCPGPATLDLGEGLHLVFLDSEWLLRAPADTCGTADDFYQRLEADLQDHRDGRVVVLAHHPMASGGPHGGHVSPFDRGPLIYYLTTKAGAVRQDLASGAYSHMIERLGAAFAAGGAPPIVFAAGHDHNLQVIRTVGPRRPSYQLVSGSGSRTSNARRVDGTRYATNNSGYMRLDFLASTVRLVVYAQATAGGAVQPVFSCDLTSTSGDDDCPEARLMEGHR